MLTLQTARQHTRRRTPPRQKGRVVMTVRGTKLDHAHHVLFTRQLQRACREHKVSWGTVLDSPLTRHALPSHPQPAIIESGLQAPGLPARIISQHVCACYSSCKPAAATADMLRISPTTLYRS
jgi:hypothetical protein